MKNGDRCLFRPILPEDGAWCSHCILGAKKISIIANTGRINEFTHDDLYAVESTTIEKWRSLPSGPAQKERDPRRGRGRSPSR